MGQYWQFFNASRREYKEVNGLLKFGEFFWAKQGFLVRSITFPTKLPALDAHIKAISSTPPALQEKGLASLPMDILRGFVTGDCYGLDLDELAALAVTCRDMYHLCEPIVRDIQEFLSAPWAKFRIACVGDYADFEDFSETFLSAGDRAFIEAERSKGVRLGYGGLGHLCKTESWLVHDEVRQWLQRFSKADLKMWNLLLGVAFPPERKDWVLCNSTKKEYVRASVIAKLTGHPDDLQPFLPRCAVDLGHVLLMRISWSQDSSMSLLIPKGMDLHRGKWVGDRVFITTMDRMDKPEEGAPQWKDISDEAARELIQLFRLSCGKDWLEVLEREPRSCDRRELYWFSSDGEDDVADIG